MSADQLALEPSTRHVIRRRHHQGFFHRELMPDRAPDVQDPVETDYKQPQGHQYGDGLRDERRPGKLEQSRDSPTASSGRHDLGGTRRHADQDSQSQQAGGSASSGGRSLDGIKLWACPVCVAPEGWVDAAQWRQDGYPRRLEEIRLPLGGNLDHWGQEIFSRIPVV